MTEHATDEPTATRRSVLEGLGSVAGLSALAGCAALPGGTEEGQLRYLQVLSPVTLDPITVDDPWSATVASRVFQGLYTYDSDLDLVPVLADGEPDVSDDGTRYRVTLRDGPTFQNGNDVTAADVAYSLDPETYERADSPNVRQVEMVEAVRTPDDRTVEFRLEHPYPAFEHALTRPVVPASVRRQNPAAFGKTLTVGSGPYEVETFEPGGRAVLSTWQEYWGETDPAVETVKIVPNHAGLSRSMSLLTDQSDVAERVHPKLWDVTDRFADARVASTPSYHAHFVGFNCSPGGPTRKRKVREAVDHLIPMDDIVEKVVHPAGRRQYSPLPGRLAESWDFPLDQWREIPRMENTDRAKQLIREADVGSWTPLVATPPDMMREKIAETIVHGLRQVGFGKARVQKYAWPEFREKVTTGDSSQYDLYVGAWSGFDDPDTFLYPLFHDSMEGLTNGTFYRNDAVMERLQAARETRDRARRADLYADAITAILEDRAVLPAYTLHNSYGVEAHVDGFDPHPLSAVNPRLVDPAGGGSLRT